MKKYYAITIALLSVFSSCQKERDVESVNIGYSMERITRATMVNQKSDYVSLADNSLIVSAYDGDVAVIDAKTAKYYSTSKQWKTDINYPWPTSDSNVLKSMKLFAWTPKAVGQGDVTLNAVGSSATFSYSSQTVPADQKDVMFGYFSGVEASGIAPLIFSHALAGVKFKVGSLGSGYTINDVSISGVADNGICTVSFSSTPSYSWNINGATKTNVYHPADTDTTPGYGVLSTGSYIGKDTITLIPQPMTSTAKISLTVTPPAGTATTFEYSLASSPALSAGNCLEYTLNASNEISFSVSVSAWENLPTKDVELL